VNWRTYLFRVLKSVLDGADAGGVYCRTQAGVSVLGSVLYYIHTLVRGGTTETKAAIKRRFFRKPLEDSCR
jgi:hypothetical protein